MTSPSFQVLCSSTTTTTAPQPPAMDQSFSLSRSSLVSRQQHHPVKEGESLESCLTVNQHHHPNYLLETPPKQPRDSPQLSPQSSQLCAGLSFQDMLMGFYNPPQQSGASSNRSHSHYITDVQTLHDGIRSVRSISETNIFVDFIHNNQIFMEGIENNKENISWGKGNLNEEDFVNYPKINGKMGGLNLGNPETSKLAVSSATVKKPTVPLSYSTNYLFGNSKDQNREKTRLVVEAENIRRHTRVPSGKSKLDILKFTSQPELNCLCSKNVAKLVKGEHSDIYDKIIIVDCRFEYEYNGGHIKGAINFPKEEDVDKYFIKDSSYQNLGEKLCIVFHCEFSSHRGPKSYKKVRSADRKLNEPNYPDLYYPEMYLLEGGYKQFFKDFPELCEPQGYVEMKDPSFIPQMKLGMQSRGLSKSQRRFFDQSCPTNISLDLPEKAEEEETDDDDQNNIIKPKLKTPQTSRHIFKTATLRDRH